MRALCRTRGWTRTRGNSCPRSRRPSRGPTPAKGPTAPGLLSACGRETPGRLEGPASQAALGEGRAFQPRQDPAGLGVGGGRGPGRGAGSGETRSRFGGARSGSEGAGSEGTRPPAPTGTPRPARGRCHTQRGGPSRAEDGRPALTCHAAAEPATAQCQPGRALPPVGSQPRGAGDGRGRTALRPGSPTPHTSGAGSRGSPSAPRRKSTTRRRCRKSHLRPKLV